MPEPDFAQTYARIEHSSDDRWTQGRLQQALSAASRPWPSRLQNRISSSLSIAICFSPTTAIRPATVRECSGRYQVFLGVLEGSGPRRGVTLEISANDEVG